MSDGSEQAVFYAEPIHVFDDKSQRFAAVNTSLIEKEGAVISDKNAFKAVFSKDNANAELFYLTDGAHRVTVLAAKSGKQKKAASAALVKATQIDDEANAKETSDRVVFEGAENGADFMYTLTGSGVKEDIVIREKADVYRYSFLLRMENVAAKLDEGQKRIAFMDLETGKEVFHIPAPFMTDADGHSSADVSYDARELEGGAGLFHVTADSEWINAEKRAFPVVLDPQIKMRA